MAEVILKCIDVEMRMYSNPKMTHKIWFNKEQDKKLFIPPLTKKKSCD